LLAALDRLAGDARTRVAFVTYNNTVQFYNLKSTLAQPQMMVVPEISDIFLPSPEDLLVTLKDARELVTQLLTSLPRLFAGPASASSDSCLSAALLVAKELMQNLGGRVIICQTSMPTLGEGAITRREDVTLRGTPKELQQLLPSTDFYKLYSVEASRLQCGVDLFCFGSEYVDLATLAQSVKFAAGMVYRFPGLHATHTPGVCFCFFFFCLPTSAN
jgi:protein transport protein SEC24